MDRSKYDWATVSEYEDELVDGSDNDKRLKCEPERRLRLGKLLKREGEQFPWREGWV